MPVDSMKITVLRALCVIALISVFGLAAYSNTLNVPFVFDDKPNITKNPYTRLVNLDLNGICAGAKGPCSHRPISYVSFALNYYLGQYDVKGYHIVNIIIHIINGVLIYLFASITLRLAGMGAGPLTTSAGGQPPQRNIKIPPDPPLKKGGWEGAHISTLPALIVALLWLVHPVQIQSVTYIVQRMNSMAVMFYMASLLFFIHGRLALAARGSASPGQTRKTAEKAGRAAGRRAWALFAGCFASWLTALGCKEIAATLPLIILLYEWYFFQGADLKWLKDNLKYLLILIAVTGVCAIIYLGGNPLDSIMAGYAKRDFTPVERVLTQFRVVVLYISLLFYPHPSRFNLDYNIAISHGLFDPAATFLSMVAIFALIGLALYLVRKERLLSFCILWFFVNLIMESSVIGLEMVFEHRLYLPSIGFFLFFTCVVFRLTAYLFNKPLLKKGGVALIIFVPICFLLTAATCERNRVWQDEITLWTDSVKKSPDKARPHLNLGRACAEKGMTDEAIAEYQKALKIDPDFAIAHNNLGNAYVRKAMFDEAIAEYQKALKIEPDFALTYNNIGSLYRDKGQLDEAIDQYRKALSIAPCLAEARVNLGITYKKKGMTDEAIDEYQKALKIKPGLSEAHYYLGNAYDSKGMADEAIDEYQKALKVKPDYIECRNNLGNIYDKKGLLKEAVGEYREILKINPDNAIALFNLGNVYKKKGMVKEAIAEYRKAIEITPDFVAAHYKLGNIYKDSGRTDEAIAEYQKVLSIKPDSAAALNNLAVVYMMKGEYEKALPLLKKKTGLDPDVVDAYYNIACIYSLQNRVEEAVFWLEKAIDRGFKDWKLLRTDKDLDNIREGAYYKRVAGGKN